MSDAVPFALPTDRLRVAAGECLSCGYNLHGLLPTDRCPECGRLVSRSLVGDALQAQDSRWLGLISAGMSLAILASVGDVVFCLAYLTHWPFPWPPRRGITRGLDFGELAYLASSTIAVVASWLVTARPFTGDLPGFRRLVRYSSLVGTLVSCVALLNRPDTWSEWIAVQVTYVLTGLLSMAAWWMYLAMLARRGGQRALYRHTLIVLAGQFMATLFGGLVPWVLGFRGVTALWPAGIGWAYCLFTAWGSIITVQFCRLMVRATLVARAAETLDARQLVSSDSLS